MKLTEMVINKKLQAACNKLQKRIASEGFKGVSYTTSVTPVSNTEVNVRVEFNTFLSMQQEKEFHRAADEIANMAESALEPTRLVDDSSFGGHSTFLIKRGKKIDGDALMSEVDLTLHLPANRYA